MSGAMRILLVTHYFPPEVGAPQTRLRETVVLLQALGHEVRVMTGPPHYPDGRVRPGYRADRVRRERLGDTRVLRLPMVPRPNRTFMDRAIDHGSFAAATLAAVADVRWSDVVIDESPPLFLGLSAAFHRAVSRRPYLFHVADPWPDFPIAMGALENRLAQRVAYAMESVSYRWASLITTVTPGLVARLERKPAAAGRVRLLPNGVDVERFRPDVRPDVARRRLGWPEARLTIAYVGSVGMAQGVQTLVDAVAPLGDEGVELRIVGDGFERDRLAAAAAAAGLTHVRFDPAVPASSVPDVLAAADATVVMLRRGPLYEDSLPTKLVEGLAAGRPVLVNAEGEAARIVADAEAGYVSTPEDPASLRASIVACALDPERAAKAVAGRRYAERMFDRPAIVRILAGYLAEIVEGRSSRHG
jgi:glycosyltransferase involved in cell wall biosynthesis